MFSSEGRNTKTTQTLPNDCEGSESSDSPGVQGEQPRNAVVKRVHCIWGEAGNRFPVPYVPIEGQPFDMTSTFNTILANDDTAVRAPSTWMMRLTSPETSKRVKEEVDEQHMIEVEREIWNGCCAVQRTEQLKGLNKMKLAYPLCNFLCFPCH
eukprot:1382025-Amphidinium_carterae.1